MKRSWLAALVSVLAALLTISCSSNSASPGVAIEEREVGNPLEDIVASPESNQRPASDGSLAITVRDQYGKGAKGIPVQVTGPLTDLLTTDEKGVVRVEGPAGTYSFDIAAGCTEELLIEFGGKGSGAIAAGQTGKGTLTVRWKHRIAPAGGSYPSTYPYWPIGEDVDVTYDIIDRCKDDRAPNSSYPTFRFDPSPILKVIGEPAMKSDGNAFGRVTVRCVSQGTPKIPIFDAENPDDAVDLMAYDNWPGSFVKEIECGSKF